MTRGGARSHRPARRGGRPDFGEMQQHAGAAARLLRVLANPHRLMLLCVLAEGELSVGELNARVSLSQSALSQHLAVLREDRLVQTRREAQTIFYALAPGPALRVVGTLHSIYCCRPGSKRDRVPTKSRAGRT